MEKSKLTSELESVRARIKEQVRNITMKYSTDVNFCVGQNDFIELGKNVRVRLCSLDNNAVTVVNVVFNKGGEIDRHAHDRIEKIYVIDGSIKDLVTGVVCKEGDTYSIPPSQEHHIVSDYALLTVTWKPAYPKGWLEKQQ